MMEINNCGDCGVEEGEIHLENCDHEICPYCNRQLLSCPIHNWSNIKQEDREPFFSEFWSCCVRCGKITFDMVMVSNDMWKEICGKTYKEEDMLCPECMNFIVVLREKLKKIRGNNGQSNK